MTRKKRQFSLKSMLLLALVCVSTIAASSEWWRASKGQEQAVTRIVSNGGWVKYQYQLDERTAPYGFEWLIARCGIDSFNRVKSVSLKSRITDLMMLNFRFASRSWICGHPGFRKNTKRH